MNARHLFLAIILLFPAESQADQTDLLFPYEWLGNIDKFDFNEPSSIVFHESRGTLFLVGDAGDLCEIKTDGTLIKQNHLRDADLEGITYNPATNLLYLAVEGEERILEVDPDSFTILREFTVPREVKGKVMLKAGGQGIEAITFIPKAGHRHGGTFFVANQSFDLTDKEDVSGLFEIEIPLNSKTDTVARHIRQILPKIPDISGLNYSPLSKSILLISDGTNSFFRIQPDRRDTGRPCVSG